MIFLLLLPLPLLLLLLLFQHGAMDAEAGNVAQGAIKYQDMIVRDVMTKAEDFYILSADDLLSFKKITEIFKAGYSRVPVFDKDRNDIVGLLLVKDLIFVDPEDEMPVRNFIQIFGRSFLQVSHAAALYHSHFFELRVRLWQPLSTASLN